MSSTASSTLEEPRYPEREFTVERISAKERNSGAINFKFIHEFRQSCFHFSFSLSQQRDLILLPPRSNIIQNIQEVSPNYQFPSCLSNKDLVVEKKVKKSAEDDESAKVIKFEYKKPTISLDEDVEEDQEDQEEGSKKDSDSENQEEYSEDDLIGDFNISQYNDNETGEDNDDDDGDDDDN
ncbi:hypothetical protein M9Y10_011226 [Tritrichomonas musculus]|uniref:Uncharacterized protein n=1 Tax=Tritrichomonas musculus TaxID=1915356 RepID=A0ABR2IKG0_9EUKA